MLDAKADNPQAGGVHSGLGAFLDAGDLSARALDTFLAPLTTPLKERGALTFLWRGEAASVDLLRWIHAGVDVMPLKRLGESDLWALRLAAPDGGRFEYKLKVTDAAGERWILDPRNPHRAADPFGENSVAMTHGYARPDWSLPRGAPKGVIEPLVISSKAFGTERHERVYLPAGFEPGRAYPLLIVHDGPEYDDYADLTVSLDNLIAADDIPPLVAVLSQPGDRMSEYPRGRRHARYLVQELLPAVTTRWAISEDPADRVLVGASLGAVVSLATAFRFPGVFGGLVLKSGSYILDPAKLKTRTHPVFTRVARLVAAMQRAPALPVTRAFISTGTLEGLADQNVAMAEALRAQGVDVKFRSSWDGHHWHNWRDQLRDGLMWVFAR